MYKLNSGAVGSWGTEGGRSLARGQHQQTRGAKWYKSREICNDLKRTLQGQALPKMSRVWNRKKSRRPRCTNWSYLWGF